MTSGKKVTLNDLSNLHQQTNQDISRNEISGIVPPYLKKKTLQWRLL